MPIIGVSTYLVICGNEECHSGVKAMLGHTERDTQGQAKGIYVHKRL